MKSKIFSLIPYLVVLLIDFYLLPLFISNTGLAMLFMLVIIPLIAFGCALVYGIRRGITYFVMPIVSLILFIPSVFIFYNSSALVYAIIYGAIALIGNLIGSILKN